MKKILSLLIVIVISLFGNENETLFWNEVKNSGDIELLKLYQKKYPSGLYDSLADIKIKRLYRVNKADMIVSDIPDWLKGDISRYKYYGVGKANKHFKGEEYQFSLATKRAKSELEDRYSQYNLTNDEIEEFENLVQSEEYTDKRGRIYILLYVE